MLGYQWFHVKEENRDKAFNDILKQLGFVCENKEKIKDVIKRQRPSPRKSGERPEKGILARKK